jgi:hypothetical protein
MSERRERVDDPMSAGCSPRLRVASEYDLDNSRLDGARELRGVGSPFWVIEDPLNDRAILAVREVRR